MPESNNPTLAGREAPTVERRPLGCALAMRVMQSGLYRLLSYDERADCDELVKRNLEWFKRDSEGYRIPGAADVDLAKPHWRCVCGAVAMPLTDDTRCNCADIYNQEWTRVAGAAEGAKADQPKGGQS